LGRGGIEMRLIHLLLPVSSFPSLSLPLPLIQSLLCTALHPVLAF
jgi:hypothetical protein